MRLIVSCIPNEKSIYYRYTWSNKIYDSNICDKIYQMCRFCIEILIQFKASEQSMYIARFIEIYCKCSLFNHHDVTNLIK